jgi:hypothetical protein
MNLSFSLDTWIFPCSKIYPERERQASPLSYGSDGRRRASIFSENINCAFIKANTDTAETPEAGIFPM